MTERRRVRLLIPDTDGAHLAVDALGQVPVVDLQFEVADRLTTAGALDASLRRLVAGATLVDYLIDQTTDDESDEPIEVVAEVHVAELPATWRWVPRGEAAVGAVSALQPYVDARLAEWAGALVPALRSAWARPGWSHALREWIDAQLVDRFGAAADDVMPFRMWGISAVYRVESPAGTCWCKAVFPGFATEPAITAELHRLVPGAVPEVLAVDIERYLLLTANLTGAPVALDHDRTDDAIAALVQVQRSLLPHGDRLLDTGVALRPLDRLADHLARALSLPADDHLVSAVRVAAAAVEALGVPDTLVHGDFHPANVMVDGDVVVVFDWSDAAWGNPLVDVGAWASWFRDDPDTQDRLWRTWWAAWGLPDALLTPNRRALDIVVAAYHVVSYVHIAAGLEPLRVGEATSGVDSFRNDLHAAVSRP
jgi:hypothetical protein